VDWEGGRKEKRLVSTAHRRMNMRNSINGQEEGGARESGGGGMAHFNRHYRTKPVRWRYLGDVSRGLNGKVGSYETDPRALLE
jgi:hypothetical protein